MPKHYKSPAIILTDMFRVKKFRLLSSACIWSLQFFLRWCMSELLIIPMKIGTRQFPTCNHHSAAWTSSHSSGLSDDSSPACPSFKPGFPPVMAAFESLCTPRFGRKSCSLRPLAAKPSVGFSPSSLESPDSADSSSKAGSITFFPRPLPLPLQVYKALILSPNIKRH